MSRQSGRKDVSPEQLAKAASDRFRKSPYRALRALTCECRGGSLIIHGRLTSFYQKQLAQEVVANIEGVGEIVNQTEVVETMF